MDATAITKPGRPDPSDSIQQTNSDAIEPVKKSDDHELNDHINNMTLNTGAEVQGPENKVVTQAPGKVAPMKPENYVVPPERLGEEPDYVDCWNCKERRMTKVTHTGSSQTQLAALICCLCCGVITAIIPLCCHWCPDTEHTCEKCGSMIARQPYDGKMEAYVPPQQQPRSAAYKQSEYAEMDKQTQKNLDPDTAA